MKKKLFYTAILIILIMLLYYFTLPNYIILNSYSSTSSAFDRYTELNVIVYHCWNINQTIRDIEKEHNQINGTPTLLKINLFSSKRAFHNGAKPFYTEIKSYEKSY